MRDKFNSWGLKNLVGFTTMLSEVAMQCAVRLYSLTTWSSKDLRMASASTVNSVIASCAFMHFHAKFGLKQTASHVHTHRFLEFQLSTYDCFDSSATFPSSPGKLWHVLIRLYLRNNGSCISDPYCKSGCNYSLWLVVACLLFCTVWTSCLPFSVLFIPTQIILARGISFVGHQVERSWPHVFMYSANLWLTFDACNFTMSAFRPQHLRWHYNVAFQTDCLI